MRAAIVLVLLFGDADGKTQSDGFFSAQHTRDRRTIQIVDFWEANMRQKKKQQTL